MKLSIRTAKPLDVTADLVAAFVFSDSDKKSKERPATEVIDRAMRGALLPLLKEEEFKGKKDQIVSARTLGKLKSKRVAVVGLGERAKLTSTDLRTAAAKLARLANSHRAKSITIVMPAGLESHMRELAEGVVLGAYRFTKYMTGDRKPKTEIGAVHFVTAVKLSPDAKHAMDLGEKIGHAVNVARDLSNEPPNVIYPETLAAAAQQMAKANGLHVTVLDSKETKKRGMGLLQAVGQGSIHPPCLVHITYKVAKPKKRLIFVGKGITFDTGGISIKPAAGMQEMKHDMSGAANIVGLMQAVAALRPDIEVHGIMACAENMPDGNAYRPGDVWTSYEGKSVEIINTDAEGRLILADALTYAHKLNPDFLVDNATLTGAMVVALGTSCSGFYASNEEAGAIFQAASTASGEQMWRLPLLEELRDQLKSDVADLKHTGDRMGGSISAALFLREFIGQTKNWVHCDIAGPAMADKIFRWDPKGGTGHGVLTFLKMIEQAHSA